MTESRRVDAKSSCLFVCFLFILSSMRFLFSKAIRFCIVCYIAFAKGVVKWSLEKPLFGPKPS